MREFKALLLLAIVLLAAESMKSTSTVSTNQKASH